MTVPGQCVVLVHGLWCRPLVMRYLAWSLRREGYGCVLPAYRSMRRSPAENAERLNHFLSDLDAEVIHLVGHSLGGVVILHALNNQQTMAESGVARALARGRIVLLGSPVQGAGIARKVAQISWLRPVLGRSYPMLAQPSPVDSATRSRLGLVAGVASPGILGWLARLIIGPTAAGDGLVSRDEASIDEVPLQIVAKSHGRLLFSSSVAHLVSDFLRDGAFSDEKLSQQG